MNEGWKPTVGQCIEGYLTAIREVGQHLGSVGPEDIKSQLSRRSDDGTIVEGATDEDYHCYQIVRGVLADFGAGATAFLNIAVYNHEHGTIEGYQFASIKAKSWVIITTARRPKSERMSIQLGAMAAATLKIFHDTLRKHIAASDPFVSASNPFEKVA